MLHELKNIKNTVRLILKSNPEARNNDRLLIQKVWEIQFPGLMNMSAKRLILHLKMKRLASPKSIVRNRQRIQQEGEFRGTKYQERHQHKEEIRTYFNKSNFVFNNRAKLI